MKFGLILSLVAVIVVFTALALLYLAYLAIGKLLGGNGADSVKQCCGQVRRSLRNILRRSDSNRNNGNGTGKGCIGEMTAEEAAAVAMALSMEAASIDNPQDEEAAAVAMALHQWFEDSVHDNESYVITIRRRPDCHCR